MWSVEYLNYRDLRFLDCLCSSDGNSCVFVRPDACFSRTDLQIGIRRGFGSIDLPTRSLVRRRCVGESLRQIQAKVVRPVHSIPFENV